MLPDTKHLPSDIQQRLLENEASYKAACAPLIDELHQAGVFVELVEELSSTRRDLHIAVPILVKWLPLIDYAPAKESVVRALGVDQARGIAENALINEFRRIAPDDPLQGLKWAIGDTLFELARPGLEDELAELALDRRHGMARQMVVYALGKTKSRRAYDALVALLKDDEWIQGYAIMGLRLLGDPAAIAHIQPFASHKLPFFRTEAKKAISKLQRIKK